MVSLFPFLSLDQSSLLWAVVGDSLQAVNNPLEHRLYHQGPGTHPSRAEGNLKEDTVPTHPRWKREGGREAGGGFQICIPTRAQEPMIQPALQGPAEPEGRGVVHQPGFLGEGTWKEDVGWEEEGHWELQSQ